MSMDKGGAAPTRRRTSYISILRRPAAPVQLDHTGPEPALVLVSLAGTGMQMKNTRELLQQRSGSIYAPGDRLAAVIKSILMKMQVPRIERVTRHRLFDDATDAEAWLRSPVDPVSVD